MTRPPEGTCLPQQAARPSLGSPCCGFRSTPTVVTRVQARDGHDTASVVALFRPGEPARDLTCGSGFGATWIQDLDATREPEYTVDEIAVSESPSTHLRGVSERAPATSRPSPADERPGGNVVLACALCEAPITSPSARIAIEGSHEHFKVNPHGVSFRVGCFASAGNLVAVGPPQRAWSWFAGYAWLIESCAGCGSHLGWLFQGDAGRFHGLLLDAQVELDEPSS